MKDLGIYIHVPFCSRRCAYCDFVTYDDKSYLIDSYFKAAERELAFYAPLISKAGVKSVFFGGGTPSLPEASYLDGLLGKCNPESNAEISLEVNPGTVNRERLLQYIKSGFNRISFGVQSFDDDVLRVMGRIHDSSTAVRNITEAFEAGFSNVSIDLIFGYPLQTPEKFKKSVETAVRLGVRHLSCYSLKVCEGTPLWTMIKNKLLPEPDDAADRKMYRIAMEVLEKAGYRHYEISNFAIPGYECRHNTRYWKLGEYIGIGAGAHSYLDGRRYSNMEIPGEYIGSLARYHIPEAQSDTIDTSESMKEFVMLGFRMVDGINPGEFNKCFNRNLWDVFGTEINECISDGLLETVGSNIKLTLKGLDFANQVFMKFI